jgi:hypothetical protein
VLHAACELPPTSHGLLPPDELVAVLLEDAVAEPLDVLDAVGNPVDVLDAVGKPPELDAVGEPPEVLVAAGKPPEVDDGELVVVDALGEPVTVVLSVAVELVCAEPPAPGAGPPRPMSVDPVAHASGTATTPPIPVDTISARIKASTDTRMPRVSHKPSQEAATCRRRR